MSHFYLMENPNEAARLEGKNRPEEVRRLLTISGLQSGMKALDVGCGSGAVARLMTQQGVQVTGLDVSWERLHEARRLANEANIRIKWTEGDATAIPFPDHSFDFVWSRFLLEYLPNPQVALREMIRVARPGAYIVVADLDGQLDTFGPLPKSLEDDLQEALSLLSQTGFDPRVGRKLFSWFRAEGLEAIGVDVQLYQVYAGQLPEPDRENWREKLATGTRQLSALAGQDERWRRFGSEFWAVLNGPDLFYFSTLITVWGTKPRLI